MNAEELARTLIAALPKGAPGLFNPWADVCGDDLGSNGPDAKLRRLQQHLDCDAEFILCGEAAGWQGMRHTGLAFTSERHVVDGTVPRLGGAPGRLTSRDRPFAEPSATLVWRALYVQGIAERVVMWNALPMHPTSVATRGPIERRPSQSSLTAEPLSSSCWLRFHVRQWLRWARRRLSNWSSWA